MPCHVMFSQYAGYDLARGMWWWEFMHLLRKIGYIALIAVLSDVNAEVRSLGAAPNP